jgi:phosphate/sulfate permease
MMTPHGFYTRALQPYPAVMYSGTLNFLGVLFSSGAVAFGIISLLPVELILQVGTSAGFAMVFALLIAAIVWNLGTWTLGLPASSSHTLIGSIIGVGVANALMHGRDGTSGVDWSQAAKIGWSLLISPVVGFVCAALLLLLLKALVRNPAPRSGATPRRGGSRGILIRPRGGVLRPRPERWPEGHGLTADPHRHRTHGLRAQLRHAAGVRSCHSSPWRATQHSRAEVRDGPAPVPARHASTYVRTSGMMNCPPRWRPSPAASPSRCAPATVSLECRPPR